MKETYDLKVKQRTRVILRNFIKRSFKRYGNLRVLCLPGHECLEIFEIYDKLGIPRQNVVCLERDSEICGEIESKKTGCQLMSYSLKEFMMGYTGEPFDIVSLDLMGQIGTYWDDAGLLFTKRLMSNKAILFTNFLVQRETPATKARYTHGTFLSGLGEDWDGSYPEEINAAYFEQPTQRVRSEGYGIALASLYFRSRGSKLKELMYQDFHGKEMEEEIEHLIKIDHPSVSVIKKIYEGKKERGARAIVDLAVFLNRYETKAKDIIGPILLEALQFKDVEKKWKLFKDLENGSVQQSFLRQAAAPALTFIEMVLRLLPCIVDGSYSIGEYRSYKYVSDKGSPMHADIALLQERRTVDPIRRFFDCDAKTYEGLFSPFCEFSLEEIRDFMLLTSKCYESYHDDIVDEKKRVLEKERSFLGKETKASPKPKNKYYPPAKRKAMALDILRSDPKADTKTVAELVGENYRRVAAWRAHVTMGTYAR